MWWLTRRWPRRGVASSQPANPQERLSALVRALSPQYGQQADQAVRGVPNQTLMIPHDGHPTALANELVAKALKQKLALP